MSASAKGLFGFLVVLMLVSVVLGYEGIARLHRNHYPPFTEVGMMFTVVEAINPPNDNIILFLDSIGGRVLIWFLVAAIPTVCGILSFRYEWWILGFAFLTSCTALFCWIGFRIFLHALLDTSPLE
jgi:hypothetical protein